MKFRLVDSGWNKELKDALTPGASTVRIICPFIKEKVISGMIRQAPSSLFQGITRVNLGDFASGVSDISALKALLNKRAEVRGVKNLHAKMYLFDKRKVIVTSANLTDAALGRNHEFGFTSEDPEILEQCAMYFDSLWSKAGLNLESSRLTEWDAKVTAHLAKGARPSAGKGLGDEGTDINLPPSPPPPSWATIGGNQAYVKFFGVSSRRDPRDMDVFESIKGAGCHWACTYPKGKRPRSVKDGDAMYMARMVKDPSDILIFGRAIGMKHDSSRDDASAEDIDRRPWKKTWPHYIRVHHAEFISGQLANGISLNALMDKFGSDSFVSTQKNHRAGKGNTNPRKAYRQQAAVELSSEATEWLKAKMEEAFTLHGRIPQSSLDTLDWPEPV